MIVKFSNKIDSHSTSISLTITHDVPPLILRYNPLVRIQIFPNRLRLTEKLKLNLRGTVGIKTIAERHHQLTWSVPENIGKLPLDSWK